MAKAPEQLINQATRHAVYLEGLKAHNIKELRAILVDIETELLGRLSWRLEAKTRRQIIAAIKNAQDLMRKRYTKEILATLNRQIRELSEYEAGFEARSINKVLVNAQLGAGPTAAQLATAVSTNPLLIGGAFQGTLLGGMLDDFSDRQIKTLSHAIRAAYASGQTTQQLVRYLKDQAFPMNTRQLEAVARTSLQHAAAQARRATYEANSDIIKGYQIIATLDGRTSPECRARDGMVYPMDKPVLPPYHYRCRTTYTAALDERFSFLEEGATRAARDPETGKIVQEPAKKTYYQWLKQQPAAFQADVLGPARAKLFRDGGLSPERFARLQVDRNFRPLTLAEIKEREPLAFSKANITL
jgi:SPP1 gp7 family putative phage head morphogenesis protein